MTAQNPLICPYCGTNYQPADTTCPKCGRALSPTGYSSYGDDEINPEPPPIVTAPIHELLRVDPQPIVAPRPANRVRRNRNTPSASRVILVLIFIVIAAIMAWGKKMPTAPLILTESANPATITSTPDPALACQPPTQLIASLSTPTTITAAATPITVTAATTVTKIADATPVVSYILTITTTRGTLRAAMYDIGTSVSPFPPIGQIYPTTGELMFGVQFSYAQSTGSDFVLNNIKAGCGSLLLPVRGGMVYDDFMTIASTADASSHYPHPSTDPEHKYQTFLVIGQLLSGYDTLAKLSSGNYILGIAVQPLK